MDEIRESYDPASLPDKLAQVLQHWTKLKGERAIPLRSMFDPVDVPSLLPNLLMVEVDRGTGNSNVRDSDVGDLGVKDFRFRLVGTYIDDRVKESYTGKNLSEIEGKGPGSALWRAYDEVARDRKPKVLSLDYIGPADGIKKSREIFLPFSDKGERVDYILVLIVFE